MSCVNLLTSNTSCRLLHAFLNLGFLEHTHHGVGRCNATRTNYRTRRIIAFVARPGSLSIHVRTLSTGCCLSWLHNLEHQVTGRQQVVILEGKKKVATASGVAVVSAQR